MTTSWLIGVPGDSTDNDVIAASFVEIPLDGSQAGTEIDDIASISDTVACSVFSEKSVSEQLFVQSSFAYEESVTDDISGVDATASLFSFPVSDVCNVQTTVENIWSYTNIINESVDAGASVVSLWTATTAIDESALISGLNESCFFLSVSDTTIIESSISITSMIVVSEVVDGVESLVKGVIILPASASDGLFVYDTPKLGYIGTILEAVGISPDLVGQGSITITEYNILSGNLGAVWSTDASITDTLSVDEALQVVKLFSSIISESIVSSGHPSAKAGLIVSAYLSVYEHITANQLLSRQLSDAISLTDNIIGQYVESIVDTISSIDSSSLQIFEIISDYIQFSESLSSDAVFSFAISEAIATTDAATASWLFSLAESINIADPMSVQRFLDLADYAKFVGSVACANSISASITEAIDAVDAAIAVFLMNLAEAIAAVDTASPYQSILISDAIKAVGAITISAEYSPFISQGIQALETVLGQWLIDVIDLIGVGGAVESVVRIHYAVSDQLSFSETLTTLGLFSSAISEAFSVVDAVKFAVSLALNEAVGIVDAISIYNIISGVINDAATATDVLDTSKLSSLSISDATTIFGVLSGATNYFTSVSDSIFTGVSIVYDGNAYECYVLNTSAFYPSVYSGFSFNSFCMFEGRAFGASNTGIYELTGDTDNGSGIHTGIVLHDTNFGISQQKKIRKAYIGITSENEAMMIVEANGERRAYTISDKQAVSVTRGVKGRTWTLSLADFDKVEFIKIVPVILARGN